AGWNPAPCPGTAGERRTGRRTPPSAPPPPLPARAAASGRRDTDALPPRAKSCRRTHTWAGTAGPAALPPPRSFFVPHWNGAVLLFKAPDAALDQIQDLPAHGTPLISRHILQ